MLRKVTPLVAAMVLFHVAVLGVEKQEVEIGRGIRKSESRQKSVTRLTKRTSTDFKDIMDEFTYNRIAVQQHMDRMAGIVRILDSVSDGGMPKASSTLKTAREHKEKPKVRTTLGVATDIQTEVLNELKGLYQQAQRHFQQNQQADKLREILEREIRLRDDTIKLAKDTSGQPVEDLSAENQNDLRRLSDGQGNIRVDLVALVKEMKQLATQLNTEDPFQAINIRDALKVIEKGKTPSLMDDGSAALLKNKMFDAQNIETEIIDILKAALEELQKQQENPFAMLQEQLDQLEQMIQQQQELQEQTEQLDQNAEQREFQDLQMQQNQLQQQLQQMQQQMQQQQQQQQQNQQQQNQQQQQQQQQQMQQAQENLQQAQQDMQQAQDELQEQNRDEAAEEQEQALDQLRQAQQQLQQQLQQMQQQMQQQLQQQQQQLQKDQIKPPDDTKDYDAGDQGTRYGRQKDQIRQRGWDVNLPERARKELDSVAKEKLPEKYSQQLRLYYRNLSRSTVE